MRVGPVMIWREPTGIWPHWRVRIWRWRVHHYMVGLALIIHDRRDALALLRRYK